MSHYIVIREYKPSDIQQVTDLVRKAYLSNVNESFLNALSREITFQMIVACAAVMFIFMGVPLFYCLLAIPIVLFIMYVCIYFTFFIKAAELMQTKRPLKCWVAEVCQPFFTVNPKSVTYRIIMEKKIMDEAIEVGGLQRRIIGTIAVSNFLLMDDATWLFRLAVHPDYRLKGVGHCLVETVKQWSAEKNYTKVFSAISECQDNCRQLFVSTGFETKQMYHKQLFGSFVSLLMYQLECDLLRRNY